jgi:synaptobrevin family protein YKT6
MKIFGISLIQISPRPSKLLVYEYDLSSFGYFQKSSVEDFMKFFSKTMAERTSKPGERQSVENEDYIGHVQTRTHELSAVVICDKEYPKRVAHALLDRILDEFLSKFKRESWGVNPMSFPELKLTMAKYQNPHEADNLMKVQKELDDTKIIMHKTIESVLQRGEKLDDLVAKSDELSMASKAFYKTAKSTNSCCKIM